MVAPRRCKLILLNNHARGKITYFPIVPTKILELSFNSGVEA